MFGPEGYLTFSDLAGRLHEWVERIVCAHVLEEMKENPSRAFLERVHPSSLLFHLEKWRALGEGLTEQEAYKSEFRKDPEILSRFHDAMNERYFEQAVFVNMMLAKILADSTPLVVSIDRIVLTAPEVLSIHMDRLDWCDPSWPVRENPTFHGYYQGFDKGVFTGADIGERFCFIDQKTGLVALKNNSMNGYRRASHVEYSDDEFERLERAVVRRFVDWSIVLNPKNLPDTEFEIFQWYGWLREEWEVDPALSRQQAPAVGRRGRKPSGARDEYFRRYPDGKPFDVSWDAIAAELSEAGFPISGRMLQNYEKGRPES